MKRALLLAVLVLAAGLTAPQAAGSCLAPHISVAPTSVEAGNNVMVEGRGFSETCNDTGGGRNQPSRDIGLTLVQGTTRKPLATVDADSSNRFVAVVCIPPGTPAGPATVVVDERSRPMPIRIVPRDPGRAADTCIETAAAQQSETAGSSGVLRLVLLVALGLLAGAMLTAFGPRSRLSRGGSARG